MVKPIKEMQFRPIEGVWVNVTGDSETLADTLSKLGIIVDDKLQFGRFYDYENDLCIYYRAFALKIEIQLWQISTQ